MVKLGFSAEYVESISPAERGVFKSYYLMEQSEKYTEENAMAAEQVGLTLGEI